MARASRLRYAIYLSFGINSAVRDSCSLSFIALPTRCSLDYAACQSTRDPRWPAALRPDVRGVASRLLPKGPMHNSLFCPTHHFQPIGLRPRALLTCDRCLCPKVPGYTFYPPPRSSRRLPFRVSMRTTDKSLVRACLPTALAMTRMLHPHALVFRRRPSPARLVDRRRKTLCLAVAQQPRSRWHGTSLP